MCDYCEEVYAENELLKTRSAEYREGYVALKTENELLADENAELKRQIKKLEKKLRGNMVDRNNLLMAESQLQALAEKIPYNESRVVKLETEVDQLRQLNKRFMAEIKSKTSFVEFCQRELAETGYRFKQLLGLFRRLKDDPHSASIIDEEFGSFNLNDRVFAELIV